MKKFFVNLLLTFFLLAAALLGLEIFLRTTHAFGARISWSQPDPLLGWRFAPSREFVYSEETSRPVPFRTNRFGWKDREWKIEKEPGIFRVAVIGDSYVESLQVDESRNFLRQAETRLQSSSGKKTEWMNFGRSGAGQAEEYLVLKDDVRRFRPDLIVLFFFPVNDITDVSPATSPDPFRPFFELNQKQQLTLDTSFNQSKAFKAKQKIAFLKNHSALISLLNQRLSLLMQQRRLKDLRREPSPGKLQGYLSLATSQPDPIYKTNYNLCKKLILEIAALAKNSGSEFLLVSVNTPAYRPATEALLRQQDASFDYLFFEKDLEKFAQINGFQFVGLDSYFREFYLKQKTPLHFQYWNSGSFGPRLEYGAHSGHWNEHGHTAAAQALTEKLLNAR